MQDASVAMAVAAARGPQESDDADDAMQDAQPHASGLAWWATWAWDDAFAAPIQTLIDVPKSLRAAFAERKRELVVNSLEHPGALDSSDEALQSQRNALSLFDALIFNARRRPRRARR